MTIFNEEARAEFSRNYPEVPHKIAHTLASHPLLTLESLALLAESLPPSDLECNTGDLPLGVEAVPEQLLSGIGDRVRNIGGAGCWVALRHIEQNEAYNALIHELIADLKGEIQATTGQIFQVEGYVFITSPGGVAPYHFDPEHNLLMQVRGTKVFTMFPAGDPAYAPDQNHEAYHLGGRPELPWRAELAEGGVDWTLGPGDALFVPVMAPHFVRNGEEISVSISVVWRSEWSFAEADARAFNHLLRKAGLNPARPGRWPQPNRAKSITYRALRKIGAVD